MSDSVHCCRPIKLSFLSIHKSCQTCSSLMGMTKSNKHALFPLGFIPNGRITRFTLRQTCLSDVLPPNYSDFSFPFAILSLVCCLSQRQHSTLNGNCSLNNSIFFSHTVLSDEKFRIDMWVVFKRYLPCFALFSLKLWLQFGNPFGRVNSGFQQWNEQTEQFFLWIVSFNCSDG